MSYKEESVNKEMVRHSFLNHIMEHVKNPQLQKQIREAFLASIPNHIKEKRLKTQPKLQELQNVNVKQEKCNESAFIGGDADRILDYPAHAAIQHNGDSSIMRHNNFTSNYVPPKSKQTAPASTTNSSTPSYKNQTITGIHNNIENYRFRKESVSNLGDFRNGSEDSIKSPKSFNTVVCKNSSQDLRQLVTDQYKLRDVVDETNKEKCDLELENPVEYNVCNYQEERSTQCPPTKNQCKRCSAHLHAVKLQKHAITEIGKGDFRDCGNINTMTISVDDMINSKVINPMIHKLHRMYLNNLQEVVSIMDDVERLPHQVNEVYKSIIFKQKN